MTNLPMTNPPMKRARLGISALLVVSAWSCTSSSPKDESATRRFQFEYRTTISGFPDGAEKARIWLPLPVTDDAQIVSDVKIEAPVAFDRREEKLYGNRVVYLEAAAPLPDEIPITLSMKIERKEVKSVDSLPGSSEIPRLLEGDRLAPLTVDVKSRAEQATRGKPNNATRIRGIYDRVLADVDYDKSGSGWGKGSIEYVCDVGKGNCSDFHTLFIAMARSAEIPAVFEIGFPLPRDKQEGEIGGYHCWAWYQDGDGAWRPVDASEADKDPARAEYFFGTLCENRVAFSRGRDLVLEPAQDGGPLNFHIYPYVEVDGRPGAAKIEKTFRFENL